MALTRSLVAEDEDDVRLEGKLALIAALVQVLDRRWAVLGVLIDNTRVGWNLGG